MVGAEVLRRKEEVVEVGFNEPVAECAPESARCQRRDEAQFGIGARRCFDGDEFVDGADVGLSFGVAAYYVFLPFGCFGGRLEIEELPTGLKVR